MAVQAGFLIVDIIRSAAAAARSLYRKLNVRCPCRDVQPVPVDTSCGASRAAWALLVNRNKIKSNGRDPTSFLKKR
jgi:hypothetical protein